MREGQQLSFWQDRQMKQFIQQHHELYKMGRRRVSLHP